MKLITKFLFEIRFLIYGFMAGLILNLIANPILSFALFCIATPFIFKADDKFVKGVELND
jgi:hypothetical protein